MPAQFKHRPLGPWLHLGFVYYGLVSLFYGLRAYFAGGLIGPYYFLTGLGLAQLTIKMAPSLK